VELMMTDERDRTTTLIILWIVAISDGVDLDGRKADDSREDLLAVARATREIGQTEWTDKIEFAARCIVPGWDAAAVIRQLLDDLNRDLRAEMRRLRAMTRPPNMAKAGPAVSQP
jgi:hypothetical protein